MRIGNLIDCHLTKKFLRYIKAINELERKVRKGQNFLLQMHRLLVDVDDSEEGDNIDEYQQDGGSKKFFVEFSRHFM